MRFFDLASFVTLDKEKLNSPHLAYFPVRCSNHCVNYGEFDYKSHSDLIFNLVSIIIPKMEILLDSFRHASAIRSTKLSTYAQLSKNSKMKNNHEKGHEKL